MTPVIDSIVRFVIAVLFNGLWEAALLAIVAWIALRTMPNGNATTRHSVLAAALFASLILPVATAAVTMRPTITSPTTNLQHRQIRRVALPPKGFKAVAPATQPPATQATAVVAASPRVHIALPRPVALGIVVLWLAGAVFVLVRLAMSLLHLERLKKDALPVAVEYRAQLARWNAATKGSRTVRLCRSDEIAIPIAVGLFDAMILIPERFLEELEPADVDRIVLHELAHLRRADDWINAIERLAAALLFFNPGIAWLVAQLDLEREVACDDWVLQQNDPLPYANCLAKVVETAAWPYRAMSAPGAFLTRRAMSVRIERLLTARRDVRVRTSFGPTGVVIAALAALGIGAAFVSPSFAYTASSTQQAAPPLSVHPRLPVKRRVARYQQTKTQKQALATTVQATATAAAAATAKAVAARTRAASAVASTGAPMQVAANSPAYIDQLASAGYTNLTVDQLMELKAVGVTADYIRGLQHAGLNHLTVDTLVRLKAVGVTPEYAGQMAAAGYSNLGPEDLLRLRAVGVDPAFVARANAHGFHNLSVEQLIRLKTSGIL